MTTGQFGPADIGNILATFNLGAQTPGDWAGEIGLAITLVTLVLVLNTKREVTKAVRSARFEVAKAALITECADAKTRLADLRERVQQRTWAEVPPLCQHVRGALVQATHSAAMIRLNRYDDILRDARKRLDSIDRHAQLSNADDRQPQMLDDIVVILEAVTRVQSMARYTGAE